MKLRVAAHAPLFLVACVGSTGSGRLTFDAYAAGPEAITTPGSYAFDTTLGYHVTLTRARLEIGGVYLSRVRPIATTRPTACVTPGTYVAQVTQGFVVDALDPAPQAFPVFGEGVVDHAATGEVWLTGARIDEEEDTTVVFDVAGTATRGAETFAFDGAITIGKNRAIPPRDAALPGANPICQQRIVTPIAIDVDPAPGGALLVRVDPAGIFRLVDFSKLEKSGGDVYRFRNTNEGQPDLNLMNGLRSRDGVYTFSWTHPG